MQKRVGSPVNTETFKPQISKKSQQMLANRNGKKIEDHLIEQGERLKAKQLEREQKEKNKNQTKVTNQTSEKYLTQKFNREFHQVIMNLFSEDPLSTTESKEESTDTPQQISDKQMKDSIKSKKVNYLRLKELLICLGMITEEAANTDSKERVLLYDLWKMLKGEQ